MNIETLNWDPLLCRTFSVNEDILPEIKSSSEIYGTINCGSCLDGLPISGVSKKCFFFDNKIHRVYFFITYII